MDNQLLTRMTNKVGPLPAWAWAAIPAAAYVAYSYYKASKGDSTISDVPAGPDTTNLGSDGYGLNTGGASLPGYTAAPDGTSNVGGGLTTPDQTNETWGRQAVNYLITEGVTSSDAVTAINSYLYNSPDTINSTQMAALQKALLHFGPAPDPAFIPTTSNPSAGKPGPVTSVEAKLNADKRSATITWDRPANDGGSPILGYQINAYALNTATNKWDFQMTKWTLESVKTVTFVNMAPGRTFSFNVMATNIAGNGPENAAHVATPAAPKPAVLGTGNPPATPGRTLTLNSDVMSKMVNK